MKVAFFVLLTVVNTGLVSARCFRKEIDVSAYKREDIYIPLHCRNRVVITSFEPSSRVTPSSMQVTMGRKTLSFYRKQLEPSPLLGEKGVYVESVYRVTVSCSSRGGRRSFRCPQKLIIHMHECDGCARGYGRVDCTVNSKRQCNKCSSSEVSNGHEACYSCPIGSVPNTRKSECEECLEGSKAENNRCVLCEPGKYNDARGSTSCSACPEGFFCPEGTKDLESCAEGYQLSTTADRKSCETCEDGFYCPDGTTLRPNKCPQGFYCNGGEINPCAAFRYCPEGSIVEGPMCLGVGTKDFNEDTNTCVCQDGFRGETCETLDTTMGSFEFSSTEFGLAVQEFWNSEAEGNCPCGMTYNGTDCLDEPDSTASLLTFVYSGIKAYETNEYEVALQALSRAVDCAYKQNIISDTRPLLDILSSYLRAQESQGFPDSEDVTIRNQFYSVLIANEYILALKYPNMSQWPIFFRPIHSAKRMMSEMLEPFAQCETSSLLAFMDDTSVRNLDDLEAVVAVARCALLGVEELGAISLVPGEVYVTQALYKVASLQLVLDTALARAQILEIATFLDERDGPSPSTQQIFYLDEAGYRPFVSVGEAVVTSVPARPIIFFEDNIGETIDRIRALASRIGSQQRSSNVISAIQKEANSLDKVIRESFSGLGDYMVQVNSNIIDTLLLGATTDASAALEELEAKSDILSVGLKRIEASARKMGDYLSVLNGERVEALLKAYEELIQIQFDIEVAKAEIARAKGVLGLIKGIFIGVASIALTLAVGPLAGAAVGLAANLIPLRRRLQRVTERDAEDNGNPGVALRTMLEGGSGNVEKRGAKGDVYRNARLLGLCGFQSSDVLKLLAKLGRDAKNLAASLKAKLSRVGAEDVELVFSVVELTLGIVDLAEPAKVCDDSAADESSGSFGAFVRGVLSGKSRSPATTSILLASLAPEFASVDVDVLNAVEDFTTCTSHERRLDVAENPLDTDVANALEQGRVLLCSALGKVGFKFTKHVSGIAKTLGSKATAISKSLGGTAFGKVLGVAGGFVEIGIGVVGFFNAQAEADAILAQAENTKAKNNEAVKEAINLLKASLQKLLAAFVALTMRFDMLQVGLPFDAIINSSFAFGEDAFGLLPTVWDSIFHDVMDVLENEARLCPRIQEQGILSARRALSARASESTHVPEPLKRSLASKSVAQKKLKEGKERYRKVSEEIEKVHCPLFERTLRQVVDWGRSIHAALFKFLDDYREFESLFAQTKQRENQVSAIETQIQRQEGAAVQMLTRLKATEGDGAARELIHNTNKIIADAQYKRTILDTAGEAITLLQDFCNSHYYINPADVPDECVTDPRESLNFATPDYELLLLSLEDKMSRIKRKAKENWFDFAYDGFSDYDDEVLTVSELIDWDDFKESGYSKLSFTLRGPPSEIDMSNNSYAAIRSGLAFCGFDNVGMSSFGVLFLDSDGKIITSTTQEVGVSISLAGPFWKTIAGKRIGFSIKSYDEVPYSYSAPRSTGGTMYCRTDENPTLYGTLCDKSRSFQINGQGLNSQPLPSPYGRWDIEVVEGVDLLRARGVAGLSIVSSFKAVKAEEQICINPRVAALEVRVNDGSFVAGSKFGAVFENGILPSFLGGIGSSITLVLILSAVALMVYRKRLPSNEALEVQEEREPLKSEI